MKLTTTRLTRWTAALATMTSIVAAPALLAGCDRTESKTKTTTTKVTDTGDSIKKTTETTERKVEKSP